jgi:hypothetical protein
VATNYTDLITVKAALGITDTDRDSLINKAIAAASRGIDRFTGRRPGGFDKDTVATARIYQPAGRLVHTRSGDLLLVDEIADTTGMIVEVGTASGGWGAVTDYETQPENALADGEPITGLLRLTWGLSYQNRVRVTVKWGWPAIPDEVPMAALLQSSRLFRRKDSPEGVLGSSEWGAIRVGRLDPDVQDLLKGLMIPGIA